MNARTKEPTARQLAAQAGETTYQGNLCLRGHRERYVSNAACAKCTRDHANAAHNAIRKMREEARAR